MRFLLRLPQLLFQSPRRPIVLILGLGLILRLAVFMAACHQSADLSALRTVDSQTYVEPAESLIKIGEFSHHGTPELIRTPGYPVFLTPGILSGHLEFVTAGLQILLSVTTIFLVFALALNTTANRAVALATAAIYACEPLSVMYASYVMPETAFSFLLVLTLLALTRYLSNDSLAPLVGAAVCLAAATYMRPVSYFLPVGLTALLLARGLWSSHRRPRLIAAGLFLCACALPIAGWQLRNYFASGYSGFAAISEWNLYFYQGASVLARQRHEPLQLIQHEMGCDDVTTFDARHPGLRQQGQAALYDWMRREGSAILRQHVASYAVIHLRGVGLMLFDPAASTALRLLGLYPEHRKPKAVELGLVAILQSMAREVPSELYTNLFLASVLAANYGLLLLGSLAAARKPNWKKVFLAATAVYFLAVCGGPTGAARMRLPLMPIFCVLSGMGWVVLWQWKARRSHRLSAANPAPDSALGQAA